MSESDSNNTSTGLPLPALKTVAASLTWTAGSLTPSPIRRGSGRRGRPRSDANRVKRLRAFELYAGGTKKSEIANTLGVTKAAVSAWGKKDLWDTRLAALASRSQEAADHVIGETIADVVTRIRAKYDQRLRELDHLCTSALTPPQAKISAIKAWFELGQRVQPDALRPASDPRNLELIQDLLAVGEPDSTAVQPPTSG